MLAPDLRFPSQNQRGAPRHGAPPMHHVLIYEDESRLHGWPAHPGDSRVNPGISNARSRERRGLVEIRNHGTVRLYRDPVMQHQEIIYPAVPAAARFAEPTDAQRHLEDLAIGALGYHYDPARVRRPIESFVPTHVDAGSDYFTLTARGSQLSPRSIGCCPGGKPELTRSIAGSPGCGIAREGTAPVSASSSSTSPVSSRSKASASGSSNATDGRHSRTNGWSPSVAATRLRHRRPRHSDDPRRRHASPASSAGGSTCSCSRVSPLSIPGGTHLTASPSRSSCPRTYLIPCRESSRR